MGRIWDFGVNFSTGMRNIFLSWLEFGTDMDNSRVK